MNAEQQAGHVRHGDIVKRWRELVPVFDSDGPLLTKTVGKQLAAEFKCSQATVRNAIRIYVLAAYHLDD